jgi:hypothetical protein
MGVTLIKRHVEFAFNTIAKRNLNLGPKVQREMESLSQLSGTLLRISVVLRIW